MGKRLSTQLLNHESDLLFLKRSQQNSIIVRNSAHTHKFFAQFSLIPFSMIVSVRACRAKCALRVTKVVADHEFEFSG